MVGGDEDEYSGRLLLHEILSQLAHVGAIAHFEPIFARSA